MATSKTTTERAEQRLALVVSLLAHALFLLIILRMPVPVQPPAAVIDVTIEPPAMVAPSPSSAPPRNIIAPPSEQRSEKPPLQTNRLSEVDASVEHEQIKRGDEGGQPKTPNSASKTTVKSAAPPSKDSKPAPPQQPQPKHPAAEEPPAKSRLSDVERKKAPSSKEENTPKDIDRSPGELRERPSEKRKPLKDLLLDDATLASRFGKSAAPSAPSRSPSDLSRYQAFARPPGSGASFLGTGGVADHLPNLPDGDITLLNEKASTYAGFVRRVAIQVFTQLRSQGWERLDFNDIRRMNDFTTIEAVLSPAGELLKTNMIASSGSSHFDSVLSQAVTRGAKDPNPPPGAQARDGMIHFIFKARSWADITADRRSGAPSERRWILLATGLE